MKENLLEIKNSIINFFKIIFTPWFLFRKKFPLLSFAVSRLFTMIVILFFLGFAVFGLMELAPGDIVDQLMVQQLFSGDTGKFQNTNENFSNDQYETLLDETDIKYSENYHFGEVYGSMSQSDVDNITKDLNSIGNTATLNEQEAIIKNIFTSVAATAATNGEVTVSDKFTLGQNIIFDLIKESITQIVLQVLSPKVMILYAINSYFMGDAADGDFGPCLQLYGSVLRGQGSHRLCLRIAP